MSSESSPESPSLSEQSSNGEQSGNLKRTPSDTFFNTTAPPTLPSSPDHRLSERSKSEANLIEQPVVSKASSTTGILKDSTSKISEQSRVYWDLSKAGLQELEDSCRPLKKFETSLPTIKQQDVAQYIFSSSAESFSQSNFLHRSMENLLPQDLEAANITFIEDIGGEFDLDEYMEKPGFDADKLKQLLNSLDLLISEVRCSEAKRRLAGLLGMKQLLDKAWQTPCWGRDYATALCSRIKQDSVLSLIESIVADADASGGELVLAATSLLGQALTRENIDLLSADAVRHVIELGKAAMRKEEQLALAALIVLESLLKHSATMCSNILRMNGLQLLVLACQCKSVPLQRHCAQALANLALFGDREAHRRMAQEKVPDWLFPLAFTADEVVQYYACLAICVLSVNKELTAAVASSGTLQLVLPWLQQHVPSEFRCSDEGHFQGRSPGWLQRLMTLLACDQPEAQALASFHFAMEACVKKEQSKARVFADIGAMPLLRKTASGTNHLASRFAAQAMRTLGEQLPHRFPAAACAWTEREVAAWLAQLGFADAAEEAARCRVDGDLLLQLDEADMRDSLSVGSGLLRRRLARELQQLRASTDYSPCDPTSLADWLRRHAGAACVQYAYPLLCSGCDRRFLPNLTDEMLVFAGVANPLHRCHILRAVAQCQQQQQADRHEIDVFISYRRSNGSLLASLLRVHLQLRGYAAFLDVYRLPCGRFDSLLLQYIRSAKNFIIVLTPAALDNCAGDSECNDWLHRELAAALEANCNIIPVIDPEFVFPPDEQLPEDIRCLKSYNGVPWKHEYQEACISKIESFLSPADSSPFAAPLSLDN